MKFGLRDVLFWSSCSLASVRSRPGSFLFCRLVTDNFVLVSLNEIGGETSFAKKNTFHIQVPLRLTDQLSDLLETILRLIWFGRLIGFFLRQFNLICYFSFSRTSNPPLSSPCPTSVDSRRSFLNGHTHRQASVIVASRHGHLGRALMHEQRTVAVDPAVRWHPVPFSLYLYWSASHPTTPERGSSPLVCTPWDLFYFAYKDFLKSNFVKL